MKNKVNKNIPEKHVCGLTGQVFATEAEYLNHVSTATGYKPTDPEHQGSVGLMISKEALRRGGKLTKTREAEIDAQIESVKGKNVDDKIMVARREIEKGK